MGGRGVKEKKMRKGENGVEKEQKSRKGERA